MKKFLMPLCFNAILLLCFSLLGTSCSKSAGNTTSKLKIVSGNLTSVLATKANNGLFLYGKSSDGKFFTKQIKIENNTADLVFPNGSWNFYAVAWEYASHGTMPNFMGKTYCGKTSAVLNGTDATIAIDLTNIGCNDPAFSANTKFNSTPNPGIYELPSASFLTCKNLASVVSGSLNSTLCDKTLASDFNKGYATSYRLVAFEESKNFGNVTPVKIAESMCVATDANTSGGHTAPFEVRVPTTFGNGFSLAVEIFYGGSACDGSKGVDVIPFNDNPRLKTVVEKTYTPSKYFLHVKSDAADVCVPGPRMATTSFATGTGTTGRPYAICTKEQFNNISMGANFGSNANKSFELLADLDFKFGPFIPIGESSSSVAAPATPFTGNFDGGGRRLDNIRLPCDQFTNPTGNSSMGIFRKTSGSIIRNFTVNKIVADCKDKLVNNVGAIIGEAENTTISNINIFGFIAGKNSVGGAVGVYSLNGSATAINSEISSINAEVNVEGVQQIGGLVGKYSSGSATAPAKIFQSSVKGKLNSRIDRGNNNNNTSCTYSGGIISSALSLGASCYIENNTGTAISSVLSVSIPAYSKWYYYSNGSSWLSAGPNPGAVPFDSKIGGLVGELFGNSTQYVSIDQISIYLQGSLEGSRYIGGMFGKAENLDVHNSYVSGVLKSYTETDGNPTTGRGNVYMGGVGGYLSNAMVEKTMLAVYHSPRFAPTSTDSTYGSVSGNLGGVSVSISKYLSGSTYLGLVHPVSSGGNEVSTLNLSHVDSNFLFNNDLISSSGMGLPSNTGHSPGDDYMNLVDGSCYQFGATIWTPSACKTWVLPASDEGYDVPRLSWEVAAQAKVPYLRRECSGRFITPSGDGSAANPFSICTFDQLKSMASTKFYSLKKSLVGDGAPLDSSLVSTTGVYRLEGNGYSISNLNFVFTGPLSLYKGIFGSLAAESSVSNLNLSYIGINPPTGASINGNLYMGILAGYNAGSLSNIKVEDSRLDLVSPQSTAAYPVYLGGLVGQNGGVLQNIQSNVALTVTRPVFSAVTPLQISAGGLVGDNYGKINGARINGELARVMGESRGLDKSTNVCTQSGKYFHLNSGGDYFCPNQSGAGVLVSRISASETWGGAVGENSGWLSEIQYEGSLRIRDFSDNANGFVAPFIGKNIINNLVPNSGLISDIKYKGRFDSNKSPISSFMPLPLTGTYQRLVLTPEDLQGVTASASFVPAGAHSICASNNNSYSNCHDRTYISAQYTNMGLTFQDNSLAISGLDNMTDWNLSTGFLPDITKTWKLHGIESNGTVTGQDLPDLMKADGDFSDIGKGF